ncbi:hypothetical protein GFPCMMHI_02848 [Ensifer adhaerens]|nr:hypothetical protein [Ensifer adhaerens]
MSAGHSVERKYLHALSILSGLETVVPNFKYGLSSPDGAYIRYKLRSAKPDTPLSETALGHVATYDVD